MRRSSLALALLMVAWAAPSFAADCSSAGTRAFRTQGVDAAFAAFSQARTRAECLDDPQLAFNYARTVQTLLDRDGDDERACGAAEAYAQAATDADLPGAVRSMAAKGQADMKTRCAQLRAAAPVDDADYDTLVKRARAAVRGGDPEEAAVAWKAASRRRPDAPLPHRALCSLLPNLDRADEGRGHCRAWRTLEPAAAAGPLAGPDRTWAWVFTGTAVAALGGGAVFYGGALGAADDAAAARSRAVEAGGGPTYEAARQDMNAAIEQAESDQTVAFALLGTGAVLAGLAVWQWLDDGTVSVDVAAGFDGRRAWIGGRF